MLKKMLFLMVFFVAAAFICYPQNENDGPKTRFAGNDYEHSLYYTYLSPTRDEWQMPDKVIKAMRIRRGEVIADIGAGSGYFTFKFARAVGPEGKVYAFEISDLAINIITEIISHSRVKGVPYDNILVKKNTPESIGLGSSTLDAAFICELHLFRGDKLPDAEKRFLESVYSALKDGWRLVMIEKYERQESLDPQAMAGMISSVGFKLKNTYDFLPLQTMMIFEK